jgi:hypothetical protein
MPWPFNHSINQSTSRTPVPSVYCACTMYVPPTRCLISCAMQARFSSAGTPPAASHSCPKRAKPTGVFLVGSRNMGHCFALLCFSSTRRELVACSCVLGYGN